MMTAKELENEKPHFNPHGLGDPNDKSLRKVELEVMIPKKMREKAKLEKCAAEVGEFQKCCSESGFIMVYTCRPQNQKMKDCLTRWFRDEGFRKTCENEYLEERSKYRLTGKKTGERIKRM